MDVQGIAPDEAIARVACKRDIGITPALADLLRELKA
jgi:hypothetical protein